MDAPSDQALDAAFDAAVEEFLAGYLAARPTEASYLGLTEHDHRLGDTSVAGFAARRADNGRWLARFEAWPEDELSEAQRIDRSLLCSQLGISEALAEHESWRRNPLTYLDNGVFELFMHGTRSEVDAVQAALDRLRQVHVQVADGRANLDPSVIDAELLRQWSIPNVGAQANFLRHGLGPFVEDAILRAGLEEAGAEAAVAYDEFAQHLEAMAEECTGTFVFGEEFYDLVLQLGEGFACGARELRTMGQAQVEELDAAMSELATQIDGTSDWRQVIDRLRGDHPADMDDLLRSYREETARARDFVRAQGIMGVPEGEDCAVEPAPLFLRAAAPVASYFPPPYYGPPSRGTFNVPFTPDGASPEEQESRLRSNSFFEIPGVTAHEAYPGHHLHFVVSTGASALRQVLTSTYMIEGWGLYVEQMMGEQGYYRTPEARLGQLSMRLFRAGRIVVDTSLHLGEMSMEEATTFMSERCGFPRPTAAREVLRYCSHPTQASAYLTGALEIERMAGQWVEQGLGSLAQFHDALTRSGKLPLGVAARAIGLIPAG